ncbi:MAG: hypothetical protein E7399_04795, partial [Ruminococcaceae bacterium]|nr:hypothetical protein [Oscillospiraceae bacterium]
MMKQLSKRMLSLAICLILLMGTLTVVSAADYTALDLSGTVKTVLAIGETSKIAVTGTTTEGTSAAVTSGVTFKSNNEEIATVSADGTVTAVREGIATITATAGKVSKRIIFMVGETVKALDFEDEKEFSITADKGNLDAAAKRTGAKGLKVLAKGADAESKVYIEEGTITEDVTTVSFWAYDDGTNSVLGRFGIDGYGGSPRNTMSLGWGHRNTSDECLKNHCLHGDLPNATAPNTSIARSKGWHQVVANSWYETDDTGQLYLRTYVYIDGQATIQGKIKATTEKQLFKSAYFNTPTTANGGTDNGVVYIDDYATVDVRQKSAFVTVNVGNHGAVTKEDGTTVSNGATIVAEAGQDLILKLQPEEGYKGKVVVDGTPVAVIDGQVTVENVTDGMTINVTFPSDDGKLDYSALDLTGTEKTVLKLEETSAIVVKGIAGGITDDLDEGVSFNSSNPDVASVDEDGVVTANSEGLAFITATYGVVSKTIAMIVGTVKVQEDYETDMGDVPANLTGANDLQGNANYYNGDWKKAQELTTQKARSGKQSMQLNALSRVANASDKSETAAQWPGFNFMNLAEEDQTVHSVNQLWFYDDGTAEKQIGMTLWANQTTNDTPLTKRLNVYVCLSGECYSISGDNWNHGTVNTELPRSEGWHQLITVGAPDGFTIYIDGDQFANIPKTEMKLRRVGVFRVIPKEQNTSNQIFWIDDFAHVDTTVSPQAPKIRSLTIDGVAQVGQTLIANADAVDFNGDEVTVEYQWQVYDGTKWDPITGATAKEYKVQTADLGKQLRVLATPKTTVEPKTGETEESEATAAVKEASVPPAGSELNIDGVYESNKTLKVTFKYTPSISNIEQGESLYIFETAIEKDGEYTPVQNSIKNEYTIGVSDTGKWLRIRVIPKDKDGLAGEELESEPVQVIGKIEYFVSAEGSDANPGTLEEPFATVEKARDTIRSLAALPNGGITVNIMGGTYPVTKTIVFTAEDSGTKECPITYQAYHGETVTFTGAVQLDTTKIQKVTDETLLNRLIEEHAKDDLYMIDLGAQGITPTRVNHSRGTRIYLNGVALYEARWPNNHAGGMHYFTNAKTANKKYYDTTKYNKAGQPAVLEYTDTENRSARWQFKKDDIVVSGAIAYLWAQNSLRIDKLDTENKVFWTTDNASYGQDTYTPSYERHVYFKNIFEEIDLPGESYIDREKNILYFYPVGDMKNPEMQVATNTATMVSFNGASHIIFDGLDFRNNLGLMIDIKDNTDSIIIRNGVMSGASSSVITMKGSNHLIENCNIYDMMNQAIALEGGNRETLTSSGIVIKNNKIHTSSGISQPAMTVKGVGHVISHNEFFDLAHSVATFQQTNNVVVEYNKIYDAQLLNDDGGALYWGRNATEMGNIVRHNYFEHIYSGLGSNPQHAIFTDDGTTGPAIYGNIFNDAGGGGLKGSYSIRTNGGQFHHIYNNLFMNTDYPGYLKGWGHYEYEIDNILNPAYTWCYHFGFQESFGRSSNKSNPVTEGTELQKLIFSDTWKKYYTEVEPTGQWKTVFNYFNPELYNAAKPFHEACMIANAAYDADKSETNKNKQYEARKAFWTWLNNNIPIGHTSMWEKNVYVNIGSDDPSFINNQNMNGTEIRNCVNLGSETLSNGKPVFVDYGKDYTLTADALTQIRKTVSDFAEIEFSSMGTELPIGGGKPGAVNLRVTGVPTVGQTVTASYTFTDVDGDDEGYSEITWFVSDSKNGEYTMLDGGWGANYTVAENCEGKYIRYELIPHDIRGDYALNELVSEPIYIEVNTAGVDKIALWKAINDAESMLENAEVGTEAGQYPEETVADLEAALEEARKVANDQEAYQFMVNQATETLQNAMDAFKNSAVSVLDDANVTRMTINSLITGENQGKWIDAKGNNDIVFENGSMILGATGKQTIALYNDELPQNTEITFKMKAEVANSEKAGDDGWIGIYFRQDNTTNWGWVGTCAMFDLKQDRVMFQEYAPESVYKGTIEALTKTDKKFEYNKEHEVTVGVYDLPTEKVMIALKLDGEDVYSDILDSTALLNAKGYFVISSSANSNNFKVTVSPVYAKTTQLEETVANAKEFLETAVVGDGYGEYPQQAIDALKEALENADSVSKDDVQSEVDKMELAIRQALTEAKGSSTSKGTITANGTVTVNYNYPTADLTVDKNATDVTMTVDPAQGTPAITVDAEGVAMEIQEGTVISGDFKLPLVGTTPSGDFTNGDVDKVYGAGSDAVTVSKPVRIVLEGAAGKVVAYKNEKGSYSVVLKNIKEDSYETAESTMNKTNPVVKISNGKDIVIYTNLLTEFVTYELPPTTTPTVTPTGRPTTSTGTGGGGGVSIGSNNNANKKDESETSKFTDIIGHWAEKDINDMATKGIVSGVTATTFEPDRSITRAEFAALMAR